jgi:circadian clock protein KaiB
LNSKNAPKKNINSKPRYGLSLFIAGATVRSQQAVAAIYDSSKAVKKGQIKIKVVDIFQQPELAKRNQIVVTPTLILVYDQKIVRFIGLEGIIKGFTQEIKILK